MGLTECKTNKIRIIRTKHMHTNKNIWITCPESQDANRPSYFFRSARSSTRPARQRGSSGGRVQLNALLVFPRNLLPLNRPSCRLQRVVIHAYLCHVLYFQIWYFRATELSYNDIATFLDDKLSILLFFQVLLCYVDQTCVT